ncbi:subunit VIII of photosystem I reaction centre [Chloropicon roscoffensis]|uniref:Photosystem I reaction center subunit VIII n=1 Tax=Chloropicon roscoffensis TaxID=1461544 RepID=A0AAX4PDA5_9CHLO|mmetsp:Transcript_3471/g.10544  ORF Transcript_3471/g.10544 Transcript_3471/m.10544 type:complete len:103 (+) Transcript_3471:105-413(+)
MKVTAAKTMPRSCVRAPATRGARIATRMSAGKKTTSKVSNQVAAAAALTALTASAPALAAVNEVGQVAGAEFLPSVLVPLVGLVFPGIAMAASFIYLESEKK